MGKLIVFDFDGTLTKSDSFVAFIKFAKGSFHFYSKLWYVVLFWFLSKLKIVNTNYAKQKVFSTFFKGMPIKEFNTYAKNFAAVIPNILRDEAISTLEYYQKNAINEILIVSASIENWIIPWAEEVGISKVIATQIEIDKEGKLTGKFNSPNCKGEQKRIRLLEAYPSLKAENLIVYGDSSGDKEIIAFAGTSFYKNLNY